MQSGNLKLIDETWYFSIFVTNDDIPENSYIIIDINSYYNYDIYDFDFLCDVDCYYNNKELKCEYFSDDNAWYESIRVLAEKDEGSFSTVTKWNNVNGDYIYLNLETDLIYDYATKIIEDSEGKYYFNVSIKNDVVHYSRSTIDILLDNTPDIVYCDSLNYYLLNCKIEEKKYNSNSKIYISKDKSEFSSISWNNLYINQPLFPIKLNYIHSYFYLPSTTNNQNLDINIIAYGEDIKHNYIVPIKLCIQKRKKVNQLNYQEIILINSCEYNYGIIFCSVININKNSDEVFIINEEKSSNITIEWNNPGNYSYDQTIYYNLTYEGFLYCFYDNDKNYYFYSLKSQSNAIKGKIFVMDLYINNINSYGLCLKDENRNDIIECHTPIIEKKDDHEIVIKNGKIYGNTLLNGFNDNIIYPNNIVIVAFSKAFDLEYTNNKWQFKIKASNNIKLNEMKILDVLIDNKPTTSYCEDSNDIILCKVNEASQLDTQLIKLTETYSSNNNKIYLVNLNQYGIPLLSIFKLEDSLDIEYNYGWSFKLKLKNYNSNINIPTGSIFTIDINYDLNKEDLALCSEYKRENDEFILLCIPQFDIPKKDLITLSTKEKSRYASIIFVPAITEENSYLFFYLDLIVDYVSMIEFDTSEQKWKFDMIVTEADIPINARIRLDLQFNEKNSTATCILKEMNKFECIVNELSQKNNDIISIWPIKIKGTVTLTPPEKLKFVYEFDLVKAYNLKFDSKWSFNILLAENRAKNGLKVVIGILIDDEDAIANCIYNDNILNCEVDYEKQDKFNIIKIKKEQNDYNDKIAWNNIDKIIELYLDYNIHIINANGGFHEGKWRFNLLYDLLDISKKIYGNYVLLDILVNGKQSTAICEITYSSFLKCFSNHEKQKSTDVIKIGVNKDPILGTVTIDEIFPATLNEIKPANISINYNSNLAYVNENNNLEIAIEGTVLNNMNHDLEEDTVTGIEIVKYFKNKISKYKITCLTNNILKKEGSYIYLICPTELQLDSNTIEIVVDDKGNSNYIRFDKNKNIKINYYRID